MQISDYPFEKLPFSRLFKTYVSDFDSLKPFFSASPFASPELARKAEGLAFAGDRQRSADILDEINGRYEPDEAARANIERLKAEDALAIVTGQQLGVYGGPLYTVFKTITTIHLAGRLEESLSRPVIPVFWLADEDHDYDEVRRVTVLNRDEVVTCSLPEKGNRLPPVAGLPVPDELQELRQELREALYDTDFSERLWDLLDSSFRATKRFDYSFGDFISRLFSKHGLVLAGSNHPLVKYHTRSCMQKTIEEADRMREALESQTGKLLEEGYHQQVTLYDSNLFFLDPDKGRVKISRNGDGWKTDTGKEWTTSGLAAHIEKDPERFSPNVFLRPVLQDMFLPTLGYVAGPGETAYYAQMKTYYDCFDLEMPVIFPRLSGTFIEPPVDRILGELPFEIHEYDKRIEDLESEFVDRTEQADIEKIFSDWKQQAGDISEPFIEEIKKIDPTLEGAAGKAESVFFGELDKLKGKVYRSVKQQEKTQLDRIEKIKTNLFPAGDMQERTLAAIYFMNKYGVDIWDRLLEALDEGASLSRHKIIRL